MLCLAKGVVDLSAHDRERQNEITIDEGEGDMRRSNMTIVNDAPRTALAEISQA